MVVVVVVVVVVVASSRQGRLPRVASLPSGHPSSRPRPGRLQSQPRQCARSCGFSAFKPQEFIAELGRLQDVLLHRGSNKRWWCWLFLLLLLVVVVWRWWIVVVGVVWEEEEKRIHLKSQQWFLCGVWASAWRLKTLSMVVTAGTGTGAREA